MPGRSSAVCCSAGTSSSTRRPRSSSRLPSRRRSKPIRLPGLRADAGVFPPPTVSGCSDMASLRAGRPDAVPSTILTGTPKYGSKKPCSRRQLMTWAVTAESCACHYCPRRRAAPSSSGHGRSPGDHPPWLGLRPRRQLRQRATEGRPRQRRRATRTPPRHGTAATCALASFLVVVVQRGGRRFESCSYRQGGQCLAGRSPSPDTLLFAPLSPCAYQPSISSTRSSDLGAPGRGRDGVVRPGPRRGPIRQRACSCQITGKRTAPLWRRPRRWHHAIWGDVAR